VIFTLSATGIANSAAGISNQSGITQTIENFGPNALTAFKGMSTADDATFINANSGGIQFSDNSKAGNAQITNEAGGFTVFFRLSSGDNAQFITDAGGLVDISPRLVGSSETAAKLVVPAALLSRSVRAR